MCMLCGQHVDGKIWKLRLSCYSYWFIYTTDQEYFEWLLYFNNSFCSRIARSGQLVGSQSYSSCSLNSKGISIFLFIDYRTRCIFQKKVGVIGSVVNHAHVTITLIIISLISFCSFFFKSN